MNNDFQTVPLYQPLQPTSPASPKINWMMIHKKKLIIGGSLGVLLIALLWFIFGQNGFSQDNVVVKVEGPQELAAGELVDYKVSYQNKNKISLSNAKLTFFYPDDMVVMNDDDISSVHSTAMDLGTIVPGSGGSLNFRGYLVGDKGNAKVARAVLSFSVKNISSVLEKEGKLSTTINRLSIPMTLVAPPRAESGQKITYIVDYRNQSDEDKNGLRLKLNYPANFIPESFTPQPTVGKDTWDIAVLKQASGDRISVTGTIRGAEREAQLVSALLQRKITTFGGEKFIDYEKTDASTVISSPTVEINIFLNDSENYVAHVGDNLQYSVEVKNNSDYDIIALNLTANLEGNMFDYPTVESAGFFDSRTKTIIWNSSVVPAFADLKPRQTVKIPFSVRLKRNFPANLGTKASFVKASAHLETDSAPPELGVEKLIIESELITRISTTAVFDQKVLINDPLNGAEGPFPPRVDQKTAFYIHWLLTNPANDISSAKITAVLAPGVNWDDIARVNGSQPLPSYNFRNNTVTWNLEVLPGGVGISFPIYEAVFRISIIPSVNQIKQPAKLLNNINFSGIDSFTKEKIIINLQEIITNNVSDSGAVDGNVGP